MRGNGPKRGGFRPALTALALAAALGRPAAVAAQDEEDRPGALDLPRPGYQPRTIHAGDIVISPELDVGGEYDSNIYARPSNRTDDFVLTATPRVGIDLDHDRLRWTADAYATLRRYADHASEDSTGFGAKTGLTLEAGGRSTIGATAGFVRHVEDRGEPEGEVSTLIGPRRFDDLSGRLFYRYEGARIGFQASGEVHRLNYLRASDAERDHRSYRGELRGFYRASPLVNVFVEGYFNRRDYRLATDLSGINRDANTYGGSIGAHFDPGGKLTGEASVGLFRFEPDDPLLKPYNGAQFAASLTYAPRPRTAIVLTAFRGDVATVQTGALARTDTRLGLDLRQEVRHNLLFNTGLSWRSTAFRGTPDTQRIWGGHAELEYLFSGHVSLAATLRYKERDSDLADLDYARWRSGLTLRLRY